MGWRDLSDDAQRWFSWGSASVGLIVAIAAGAYWNWWSYLWDTPPPVRSLLALAAAVLAFVLWYFVALIGHHYFGIPKRHPLYLQRWPLGLSIHSAQYGIGDGKYQNVTTLLKGHIKNNRIDVQVENPLFPPRDPFPGQPKHLVVVYSIGGGPRLEIVRHEHDQLRIPEEAAQAPSVVSAQDIGDRFYVSEVSRLLLELASIARNPPPVSDDWGWFYKRALDFIEQAFAHNVSADFHRFHDSEKQKLNDFSGQLEGGRFDAMKTLAVWCEARARALAPSDIDKRFVLPKTFDQYRHTAPWPKNVQNVDAPLRK